jgi:hypothetical protein
MAQRLIQVRAMAARAVSADGHLAPEGPRVTPSCPRGSSPSDRQAAAQARIVTRLADQTDDPMLQRLIQCCCIAKGAGRS